MARVVIIGGGLAGASTAEALREGGYDGEVVLLGSEQHLPYDRPPLSKGFLKGEASMDDVTLHDQQWYDDQQITVRTGVNVTGLVTDSAEVTLDGGERLGYDTLVLATGSEPRLLALPGAELAGVLTLRRLEDSARLKTELGNAEGRRLVLIGGGWIGLEVGSAFRDAGAEVTVLETAEQPLLAALGPEMGAWFADLHRRHGTDVHTGATVRSIKAGSDPATVGSVVLGDGTEVPADLILVGVGATPRTELAEAAGLNVDNGVVVDAQGRTSDPKIFATGDIANFPDPVFGHIRIEHWAHALNHPKAVAAAILGSDAPYDKPPFFYSDQYDLGMEYAGRGSAEDQLVTRGKVDSGEFIAFWTRDGRVRAGMNVNVWDVNEDIQKLIQSQTVVDERLADPAVPLTDLLNDNA